MKQNQLSGLPGKDTFNCRPSAAGLAYPRFPGRTIENLRKIKVPSGATMVLLLFAGWPRTITAKRTRLIGILQKAWGNKAKSVIWRAWEGRGGMPRAWAGARKSCFNHTDGSREGLNHTLPSAASAVYCNTLQLCPVPAIVESSALLYSVLSYRCAIL